MNCLCALFSQVQIKWYRYRRVIWSILIIIFESICSTFSCIIAIQNTLLLPQNHCVPTLQYVNVVSETKFFCVKRMHMFLLLLNCSWIIRHASVLFSHHSQVDLKAVFLNFNDGSQEPALNVFDGACTTRMDPVSISVDVVANKAIWCFHFIDFDYHLFPIGTVTKALHWFQTPEQCNYWWNRLIIACISKNTTSMR